MQSVAEVAVRPSATRSAGLTHAEVEERRRRGYVNVNVDQTSRTTSQIVQANVFTRFNAILGALLVLVLIVGPLQDALFGLVLVANTAIGVVQELRAKHTLDRLVLVNAPRVRVVRDGRVVERPPADVVVDDVMELGRGDQIVVDGTVLDSHGLEVDESLLTGESDPVVKNPGDGLLSGSFVVAGNGRCVATRVGSAAHAAELAAEARRFTLVRSELRDGTNRILRIITWVMLPTAALLATSQLTRAHDFADAVRGSVAGTVTMVPEGLVLLTSIAFAVGVLRLARHRTLVQELPAVEGLARVDVVCIDKTGTLTESSLAVQQVDALEDDPDARDALAVMAHADAQPNASLAAIAAAYPVAGQQPRRSVPFSSARKWSAVDLGANGCWLLGAPDILASAVQDPAQRTSMLAAVDQYVSVGHRVVLLARTAELPVNRPIDVRPRLLVVLEERVRPDAATTLDYLRREGVTVKVLSGDHPQTVGAVARRLGLPGAEQPIDASSSSDLPTAIEQHSVFGRVQPRQKQAMVAALQRNGHVVAMTGDGVNDVLALKQADLGVAMGSGSAATRAVAQIVLLDSTFDALPAVLREGRRVVANIERVGNLFVTKTVYATLLSLAVGVAQLPFPFLPRHLTVVSSLTIGIPGFFLALAPNATRAKPGFVSRVLRFAVPAGAVAAAATFIGYAVALAEPDLSLNETRTTALFVLFGVALWILAILARPVTRLRSWLVGAMAAAFLLIIAMPGLREFFAITSPPPIVWFAAVGIVSLAGLTLEAGWRVAGWIHERRVP